MTWEQIVDALRRLGAAPQHAVPVGFAARTAMRLHACMNDQKQRAGAAKAGNVAAPVDAGADGAVPAPAQQPARCEAAAVVLATLGASQSQAAPIASSVTATADDQRRQAVAVIACRPVEGVGDGGTVAIRGSGASVGDHSAPLRTSGG